MNSFQRVRAFQMELEFGSVGFCGEGKTGVSGEKPLGVRERPNNNLNPHMVSAPGFKHGPDGWEASAHCATLAPLMTVNQQENKHIMVVIQKCLF